MVGDTGCIPVAATAAPFSVTEVASVVVHESIDCSPLRMLAGDAVNEAVGIGGGGGGTVTVTLALAVVEPLALLATSV